MRAVSNSCLDSAHLHLLHIFGWFPYVFALYTFVTLFRGFLIFFFSTYRSCIHLLHLMGCFSYIFPLYTFVTLFRGFLIFFFQHTALVYICYILRGVFPMYFHCIHSLHFLRAVSNSFLDSARLHRLHVLGWFPYVFALYTFVTLFRGFLICFFSTYRSSIHLLHLMGCFSYVLALYTFVTLFESCI